MSDEAPSRDDTKGFVLGRDAAGRPLVLSFADLAAHGLICGVTGSGKTHTAKVIAQGLSALGVPILAVDAKGDFAGIARTATEAAAGPPPSSDGAPPPILPWDLAGRRGHRLPRLAVGGAPSDPDVLQLAHMRHDGVGYVGVLDAAHLISTAAAYATVMGDLIIGLAESPPAPAARPAALRLAILIEEAHLVFRYASSARHRAFAKALKQLTARGIAVVFVASAPCDLPDLVDAALSFHIQHSLWAPSQESRARLATWFRTDPQANADDLVDVVRSLEIGEALVAKGWGEAARRLRVASSSTRDGPLSPGERRLLVAETSCLLVSATSDAGVRDRPRQGRASMRSHGRRRRADRTPH
jgi:hypothetical protein